MTRRPTERLWAHGVQSQLDLLRMPTEEAEGLRAELDNLRAERCDLLLRIIATDVLSADGVQGDVNDLTTDTIIDRLTRHYQAETEQILSRRPEFGDVDIERRDTDDIDVDQYLEQQRRYADPMFVAPATFSVDQKRRDADRFLAANVIKASHGEPCDPYARQIWRDIHDKVRKEVSESDDDDADRSSR